MNGALVLCIKLHTSGVLEVQRQLKNQKDNILLL